MQDCVWPGSVYENLLGVSGSHVKPIRIIKRSSIDAIAISEAFKRQIQLCSTQVAKVDADGLAATGGPKLVYRRRAAGYPEILDAKDRLHHVRRPGRALAEATVTKGHALRLS
jgi:hypothetical protein